MNLAQKLIRKELTVGSWITLGHSSIAEIMAKAGFDWLTVDMEHSVITLPQTQQLIQAIELCGVVPLVRVGENNSNLIKRVMDAGAHGVIVPMINSKEDAKRAVASVQYPPKGSRGVGLARAQSYGMDFEGYKKWNEKESIVIVQIEHIKAIENLEEILKVEEVDGSIIGPYDLSGSLGYPGEFNRSEVKEALDQYKSVCEKLNKPMGIHIISPDSREVTKRIKEGYKFVACSSDILMLGVQSKMIVKKLKNVN